MKIAILYICTGNYSVFWKDFYQSCEKYFYPKEQKHYFVFSDKQEIISQGNSIENVDVFFQRVAGWPYDTLMRFNSFCMIQDLLVSYDYCYFWNANTVILREINEAVIPFPYKDKELVLWRHTTCYDDEVGVKFQPERNPLSTAYIAEGEKCHPYGGGFFGGTSYGFIRMSIELRNRIKTDLEHGIIAVWHDQSHIERYGIERCCIEVPKNIIASEEYADKSSIYAIFTNKDKVGGIGKLRNLPFRQIIGEKIIKELVKIAHKTGMIKIYKLVIKKFKGR